MSALEAHKLLDTRMSTSEVEDGAGVLLGALPHEYREESSCTQTTSRQPPPSSSHPFSLTRCATPACGTPPGHHWDTRRVGLRCYVAT